MKNLNFFRFTLTLIAIILPLEVCAWQSPEQAINEFVKYEIAAGRLNTATWKDYSLKYVVAPTDFDESGFDLVTVIESYKLSPIACSSNHCTAKIYFQLSKIKDQVGTQAFAHANGGIDILPIEVIKSAGDWRLKPVEGYPHILKTTYARLFPKKLASSEQFCPVDFLGFLQKFQKDWSFQDAHTIYPLRYEYINSVADPEPQAIRTLISHHEIAKHKEKIRYPSQLDVERSLSLRNITYTIKGNTVRLAKPDTDIVIEFDFLIRNNCWWLSEVRNLTL